MDFTSNATESTLSPLSDTELFKSLRKIHSRVLELQQLLVPGKDPDGSTLPELQNYLEQITSFRRLDHRSVAVRGAPINRKSSLSLLSWIALCGVDFQIHHRTWRSSTTSPKDFPSLHQDYGWYHAHIVNHKFVHTIVF